MLDNCLTICFIIITDPQKLMINWIFLASVYQYLTTDSLNAIAALALSYISFIILVQLVISVLFFSPRMALVSISLALPPAQALAAQLDVACLVPEVQDCKVLYAVWEDPHNRWCSQQRVPAHSSTCPPEDPLVACPLTWWVGCPHTWVVVGPWDPQVDRWWEEVMLLKNFQQYYMEDLC